MGFVVLGVLEEDLVHISGGVLVQLVARAEDDESYLAVTKDRQFVGFLHDAKLTLVERNLGKIVLVYRLWILDIFNIFKDPK